MAYYGTDNKVKYLSESVQIMEKATALYNTFNVKDDKQLAYLHYYLAKSNHLLGGAYNVIYVKLLII